MAGQILRWCADSNSIPDFLTWAQGMSNAMSSIGWIKTSDTGQVNFSNQVAQFNIVQVSAAGTTATYQYSGLTGGLSLANGQWVTINGCRTANFNVQSGTMANLNTGTQTFTLTITSTTATETPASATGYAASGLPQSSGNSVYEIWKMNDANQTACPCILRIDYQNGGNTNGCASMAFTVGWASNGAGTIYGGATVAYSGSWSNTYAVTAGYYEDTWFNGGTNWMGVVGWRTSGAVQAPFYFAIERSKDANGNDTSDYLSYVWAGYNNTGNVVLFKPGYGGPTGNQPGYSWVYLMSGSQYTGYGNNTGCSPVFPWIGRADNPMVSTVLGDASFGEANIGNLTLYNSSHPYIFTGAQYLGWAGSYQTGNNRGWRLIGMRWD